MVVHLSCGNCKEQSFQKCPGLLASMCKQCSGKGVLQWPRHVLGSCPERHLRKGSFWARPGKQGGRKISGERKQLGFWKGHCSPWATPPLLWFHTPSSSGFLAPSHPDSSSLLGFPWHTSPSRSHRSWVAVTFLGTDLSPLADLRPSYTSSQMLHTYFIWNGTRELISQHINMEMLNISSLGYKSITVGSSAPSLSSSNLCFTVSSETLTLAPYSW